MGILVHIPASLRGFTDNHGEVVLEKPVSDINAAFSALCAVHPGLRDRLMDEQGQLRQHINVFVGPESIRYTGGQATRLEDGVEISIVPAVSGG